MGGPLKGLALVRRPEPGIDAAPYDAIAFAHGVLQFRAVEYLDDGSAIFNSAHVTQRAGRNRHARSAHPEHFSKRLLTKLDVIRASICRQQQNSTQAQRQIVVRVARGCLLNLRHHRHVVVIDGFPEPHALGNDAPKGATGDSRRRTGNLHASERKRAQGTESFNGADCALVPDTDGFDGHPSFQNGHERNNPAVKKVHLLDFIAGPVQKVAGKENDLAQMRRELGEIIR